MIIYLWLFYGIPSFSLVVFFLFWLQKRNFEYSFYRVLQCDMIINILCYLNTWISRFYHVESTLPIMIWANDNFYFLFYLYSYLGSFFYNAQSLSVIIISGHRLWSSKSTNGKEFWNKYYGHAYVLLVIVSGLLTVPNFIFHLNKPDYYDPVKKMFVVDPLDSKTATLSNYIFLIKSAVFFSTILIINIWTIYLIRKRFIHKSANDKFRTMMKNLTTIAFINTSLFFLVLTWPIALGFFITLEEDTKYNVVMCVSDVLSLSLPYILILCDRNVQKSFSKLTVGISSTAEAPVKPKDSVFHPRTVVSVH